MLQKSVINFEASQKLDGLGITIDESAKIIDWYGIQAVVDEKRQTI
ncbi:hypothetical protein PBAL39_16044 [Pedobacter sp. BAL39]|nr:hypothetical protein [Pedobacter sp. BAL39]EDM37952.1 hypothetical protein PBAL39_16044 [Pedobacter sp. BAL39]